MALVGAKEGWCEAYVTAAYRRWFGEGQEAGVKPNISASIAEARQDAEKTLNHCLI